MLITAGSPCQSTWAGTTESSFWKIGIPALATLIYPVTDTIRHSREAMWPCDGAAEWSTSSWGYALRKSDSPHDSFHYTTSDRAAVATPLALNLMDQINRKRRPYTTTTRTQLQQFDSLASTV